MSMEDGSQTGPIYRRKCVLDFANGRVLHPSGSTSVCFSESQLDVEKTVNALGISIDSEILAAKEIRRREDTFRLSKKKETSAEDFTYAFCATNDIQGGDTSTYSDLRTRNDGKSLKDMFVEGCHISDNRSSKRAKTHDCKTGRLSSFHSVTSLYKDIGDCRFTFTHCGAKFWYGERLKGYPSWWRPSYKKCCGVGRIQLPDEREPPEKMKRLLQECHFLENIRAYNQMFAMTSFGAQVDESINKQCGPYVFKVSGQIYHWIGAMCPMIGDAPRFLQLYIYDTANEVTNRMGHYSWSESASLRQEIVEALIDLFDRHNALVRLFRTARDKCEVSDVPDFHIRLYSCANSRQHDLPTSNTVGSIVF